MCKLFLFFTICFSIIPSVIFGYLKPNPPKDIFCKFISNTSIEVKWEPPGTTTIFDGYVVSILSHNSSVPYKWFGNRFETSTVFKYLTSKDAYKISVQTSSHGELSGPVICRVEPVMWTAIIFIFIVCLILLTIIGIGVYIYYRYSNRIQTPQKKQEVIEPLKTVTNEKDIELDESLIIDRKELNIMEQIGHGQFGTVHYGLLNLRNGRVPIDVAVKMSNVIGSEDMDVFLKEALIMMNFKHPNVLPLYGISFEPQGSALIILPYMKNRDLLKYVRNEENQPTVKQLLVFSIDVAKGMEYLSKQNFIHRDLAARNCMLDNDLNVKVADFGLSKASEDYYRDKNPLRKRPIKWMAIESLEKGIYDTKTDVWSYGVLVWELLTRGITPYPNLDHFEVLPYLRNGYRLPKPNYCPDLVFEVLLKCWSPNPKLRPTFEATVNKMIEVLETLQKQSKRKPVKIKNITYYNHPVSYSTTFL